MCLINHVIILILVYNGITIVCGGSMDFVVQPYPRNLHPHELELYQMYSKPNNQCIWSYILGSSKFSFGQIPHLIILFKMSNIRKKKCFFVFSGHYTIQRMSVPTWRTCVRKPRRNSKPWRKNTRTNRKRSSTFRKNYR